jgi:phytoene desaturase
MSERPIVVIGGGVSGLCASIYLAKRGHKIILLDSRDSLGGLASSAEFGGFQYDLGPYILLDKPGLDWAFEQIQLSLSSLIPLYILDPIYTVHIPNEDPFVFYHSLEHTVDAVENRWRGSGIKYRDFVESTSRLYNDLSKLRFKSRPSPLDVFRTAGVSGVSFLLSSLAKVLHRAQLPKVLEQAICIWTRIAGNSLTEAPSPLSFVPALFHRIGAYYPQDGMCQIARTLELEAKKAGVEIYTSRRVTKITVKKGRIDEVYLGDEASISPSAIIGANGVCGVYETLLDWNIPKRLHNYIQTLPVQSPGFASFMTGKRTREGEYLSFALQKDSCTALIQPHSLHRCAVGQVEPFRVIRPIRYSDQMPDPSRVLEEMVTLPLIEHFFEEVHVHHSLHPDTWGKEFSLYRNGMNPAMTASFMRRGRFPHRCPYVGGLYFAGSSTHPGQWVSFCSISGILAAEALLGDLE